MLKAVLRAVISATIVAGLGVIPTGGSAQAGTLSGSGVHHELIGTWSVDRLNNILEKEFPEFACIEETYSPAQNGVHLYRVTYPSVIPEQRNRPTVASGLVAVPDQAKGVLPVVSYQHGTVFGKHEVPSFPEESPETMAMIAQFAGQGYVVIGADYFGMGLSEEPEGYLVKASHQQATMDMLAASDRVLADLGIERGALFLAGWSQGGFVTFALLESLEEAGIPVTAAATAAAPVDLGAALRGALFFPREIDADWVGAIFILSAFAYENYYGVPGLARSIIRDEYYELARRVYERQPFDPEAVPTSLKDLVTPGRNTRPSRAWRDHVLGARRILQGPQHPLRGEGNPAHPGARGVVDRVGDGRRHGDGDRFPDA